MNDSAAVRVVKLRLQLIDGGAARLHHLSARPSRTAQVCSDDRAVLGGRAETGDFGPFPCPTLARADRFGERVAPL